MRNLIAAGLLALALVTGYAHKDSINLWYILGQQLATDPGSGGNGGGG
ncbi:MAG TPA: hypothetical protein VFT99_07195 [Roseiflexaceae bacterium]|nr:hypothetical protein [Roseiflexaceae bacterium]